MHKIELWRQIKKLEKLYARNKAKRFIYTVLFHAAVYFQFSYLQGRLRDLSIGELIGEFVVCAIIAGVFVWFSSLVFKQLFDMSEREKKTLEYYQKEFEKLEQDKK